ncbi:MAG TPA: DnaT-like ssDNA-binding protein [Tepidisphaeraceae bacterium]|jgi:hypothetical protein
MPLASYLTLAAADALAALLPPLPRYAAASSALREQALAAATLRVDASSRWQGRRYVADQALEFPRVPYNDFRVWDWDAAAGTAVVPQTVQLAVLYEANALLDTARQARLQQIADGLTAQSTGSLSESYARVGPTTAAGRPVLIADAAALLDKYRLRSGDIK